MPMPRIIHGRTSVTKILVRKKGGHVRGRGTVRQVVLRETRGTRLAEADIPETLLDLLPLLEGAPIGKDDLEHVDWLSMALEASKRVARITFPTLPRRGSGTGFLISPNRLLTNCHVIRHKADARAAHIVFDYQRPNTLNDVEDWMWDEKIKTKCSPQKAGLDYAIIGIKPRGEHSGNGRRGYFSMNVGAAACKRIALLDRVNIIQHPSGRFAGKQAIGFRDNWVVETDKETITYTTDTNGSSSGSPVLNDQFEVVALHREAIMKGDDWIANRGTKIAVILEDEGAELQEKR